MPFDGIAPDDAALDIAEMFADAGYPPGYARHAAEAELTSYLVVLRTREDATQLPERCAASVRVSRRLEPQLAGDAAMTHSHTARTITLVCRGQGLASKAILSHGLRLAKMGLVVTVKTASGHVIWTNAGERRP